MRGSFLMTAMVAAAGLVACGGGDAAEPTASPGSSTSTTPPSASSPSSPSSPSGPSTPASSSSGAMPANCNGDEGGPVPTEPNALQTWLGTGKYKCWTHESAKHPSGGPHGGDIRTYLNAALDASMKGTSEHPQGAVAVKELYGSGTTVTGWAVGVKTQPQSNGGQGWYWYEVFGTQPGASAIEGQNKALCTNCHAAGKDFVLIPYPLR